MAKVHYVGDSKEPPQETTVKGYKFTLGQATDVKKKSDIDIFRKHPCFKIEKEG